MNHANALSDGRRTVGQPSAADVNRARASAQSGMPVAGAGAASWRKFPQGTTLSMRTARRGGGAASAANYPFQPYLSLWKGPGADPNSADRAKRFKLRRGKIAIRTPANMPMEFVAAGSLSPDVTEDDEVITQVYAEVPCTETVAGSGTITLGRAEIKTIEGADLPTALGITAPNYGAYGALPDKLILPLCEVSCWGGSIHFYPQAKSNQDFIFSITGTQCQSATRAATVVGLI